MSDGTLIACPFCGGCALEEPQDNEQWLYIKCRSCGAKVAASSCEEGKDKWNTRVQSGEIPVVDEDGLVPLMTAAASEFMVDAIGMALLDTLMRDALKAIRPYLRKAQPSEIPAVEFDEWCASVKDCGHVVQPNSATARQRKLGWDAAMETKRESSIAADTVKMCELFIWYLDSWTKMGYKGSEALKHGSPRQDAVMLRRKALNQIEGQL